MNTPVIFVIGPPGHGKTAARKILAELTSQKGESTSRLIYYFLALHKGITEVELRAMPKEDIRPELVSAGDFMVGALENMPTPEATPGTDAKWEYRVPSSLVRTLYLNGVNIIDGVRRRSELSSSIEHLEWNGVPSLVLWIERSQGPVIPDNTELDARDAQETIYNDGTLEDLKTKLYAILVKYYGPQDELTKPVAVLDSPAEAKIALKQTAPAADDLS